MASFPRDRFDDIPSGIDRVGAHRAPRPRGRGWIGFLWAAAATVVLVVAGLVGLSFFDPSFKLPFAGGTPTPESTEPVAEQADPVTDPTTLDPSYLESLTITVLNGTSTQGLSNTAADQIAAAGWPDPSRASASEDDEESTYVYYSSPADEGVARGIMQLIGAAEVKLSDAFPTSITVVLGGDYQPPAAG